MFSKGYCGPGSQHSNEHKIKKNMLKRLKKTMDKATAAKISASKQAQQNKDSKGVSSVEPTYPGFKGV